MKRIIALLLTLTMALALAACAQNGQDPKENESKTGILSHMVAMAEDQIMVDHILKEHTGNFQKDSERILYNNLSSALLALDAGEIQYFGTNTATANYIVANNDKYMTFSPGGVIMQTEFSMLTMEEDEEVYNILNNSIIALKENGTLQELINSYIEAPDGNFDDAVVIPSFEGADTIRIAITGDIPPMDYTTADGKPAGFNVALLAAIAEYAKINIEPVLMESGARSTALASDKVDAIFWVCATLCKEHPEVRIKESIPNTKATTPYIVLDAAMVRKK